MNYRDVKDFPNYVITDDGKLINKKTGHIKHTYLNDDGYEVAKLYINNKPKVKSIHRLMAVAFIPNPNNLPEVNHKDGIKTRNVIDNLEWCDHSYNIQHAWDNKLIINTEQRKSKLSKKNTNIHKFGNSERARKVQCIETGRVFDSITRAEEEYKTSRGSISNICQNKKQTRTYSKTLKIYTTWRYYE